MIPPSIHESTLRGRAVIESNLVPIILGSAFGLFALCLIGLVVYLRPRRPRAKESIEEPATPSVAEMYRSQSNLPDVLPEEFDEFSKRRLAYPRPPPMVLSNSPHIPHGQGMFHAFPLANLSPRHRAMLTQAKMVW